jgi:hypothetical protein
VAAEPFQGRDERHDPGEEVLVMQTLPGRRCPDRIDDDAKPPEDSFVPPDGTLLDGRDSPRAGDQPYSLSTPEVGQAFPPGSVHRPNTN